MSAGDTSGMYLSLFGVCVVDGFRHRSYADMGQMLEVKFYALLKIEIRIAANVHSGMR
jgi:hypothetical protein